jgi:hypothetical protein
MIGCRYEDIPPAAFQQLLVFYFGAYLSAAAGESREGHAAPPPPLSRSAVPMLPRMLCRLSSVAGTVNEPAESGRLLLWLCGSPGLPPGAVDVRCCRYRFAAIGFNSKATWFGIRQNQSATCTFLTLIINSHGRWKGPCL